MPRLKNVRILLLVVGGILLLPVVLTGQCGNLSFSSGDFSGWRGEVGCVTDQIRINTQCADANDGIDPNGGTNSNQGQHAILTPNFNGGSDPFVPQISMQSPIGDQYMARLGDYRATTITESFARGASLEFDYQVTELNSLVTLYFAIVLQDPEDHSYGERPFFSVELIDPSGNSVPCIEYVVAAQPGIPGFERFQGYFYRDWTPVGINLQEYAGQQVKLRVVSSDCGQEAHLGYAYLDATCQEPVLVQSKDVLCNGQEMNLSAPPGMETYTWRHLESGNAIVGSSPSVTVNEPGTYSCEMVPFSTSNSTCPFTLTTVVRGPQGSVTPNFTLSPEEICIGDAITLTNTTAVSNTRVDRLEWNFLGNTVLNTDVISEVITQQGNHPITLTVTDADGCEYSAQKTLRVVPPPNPTLAAAGPFCNDDPPVNLQASPSGGRWSGNGVSASGIFDPAIAGPGTYTINYEVTEVCTRIASRDIVVEERKDPTINPVGPFCNDAPPVTLVAADAGGTWNGAGTTSQGQFNPATAGPGNHTITYQFGGLCPSEDEISIEVIRRKNPAVEQPDVFCLNDPPFQLQAQEAGGNWSGPGVSSTGVFRPDVAGTGEHVLTHSFGGPCPSDRIVRVTVVSKANADFTLPESICSNEDPVRLEPLSNRGQFTGPGTAPDFTFNPAAAGPGTHTITYTIGGNCGDEVSKSITVHPYFDPTITEPEPLCSDAAPFNLEAVSPGGTWSGTGIVDPNAGTFDPAVSGTGSFPVRYDFQGECPSFDVIQVTVNQRRNADFDMPLLFCDEEDAVEIVPVETGGNFLGSGITGNTFDPKEAGVGRHNIIYDIPGACGARVTKQVTVEEQPDATLLGPERVCVFDNLVTIERQQNGGIWEGPGVDQNGNFNPGSVGEGTYTIRYYFDGNCPSEDVLNIRVTGKLEADITPVALQCNDAPLINLQVNEAGGTWSGPGIVNPTSGTFDPAAAEIGSNTITYIIAGACGDTATTEINVAPRADATITAPNTAFCFGAADATLQAPEGGSWNGEGINDQGVFTASELAPGNYRVYYSVPAQCPATDSVDLVVYEPVALLQTKYTQPTCFKDCDGRIVTEAQGGSGSGYRYTLGNNTSTGGAFSNLCQGVYSIRVEDGFGCILDTQLVLTQPDSLYAEFTVENEKCFKANGGASIDNIVGGTAPYEVRWSDGSSGLVNYSYSQGDASFVVTDDRGCTFSQDFSVGFVAGPRVYVSSDSVSCFGGSDGSLRIDSIFGGTLPYDITWQDGSKDSSLTQRPAGNYTVVVSDAEECQGQASIAVEEPDPLALVLPEDAVFCDGQQYTLTPEATGGNGDYRYTFEPFGEAAELTSDSTLRVTVFVTDRKNCQSEKEDFQFTKRPPLTVSIVQDTNVCPNTTVAFRAVGQGGVSSQYHFRWSNNSAGATSNIRFNNSGNDTLVYVDLEDDCSIPSNDTAYISFFKPAVANFTVDPNPAEGCEPLSVQLVDLSVNSSEVSYWLNTQPIATNSLSVLAGDYNVTQVVSSAQGCRDTLLQPGLIKAYPIPDFQIGFLPQAPTELTNYYQFFSYSNEPLSDFSWVLRPVNAADTLFSSSVSSPEFTKELEPNLYRLSLRAATPFGCLNNASTLLEVKEETRLYVPNSFSPNGDGSNDVFTPVGTNLEDEDVTLTIYNRWGELVFSTENALTDFWDGRDMNTGRAVPPGLYQWVITQTDPLVLKKKKHGFVTVLR